MPADDSAIVITEMVTIALVNGRAVRLVRRKYRGKV